MSKPIIGITTGRRTERSTHTSRPARIAGIQLEYPQSVERSGGAPILLPRTDDMEVIAAVLGAVDGLLLSGGGDVVSLAYGAEPHPTSKYQDPVRDRMEFEAVRAAMARRLPILGICRGIQSLNVALGGSLVQDIPDEVPGAYQHYTQEQETLLGHTIDIEPGSLLAKVLGTTSTAVNSYHHQAVKDVAAALRVNCRSRDGVIEGVESAAGLPILAVQCHPEISCQDYPLYQKLFDWIVAAAAERSRQDAADGP